MTAPSCTFTLFPMQIEFTSPRITALNQILQSSPIVTSPQSVAFGAIKQLFPHKGLIPFTSHKNDIKINVCNHQHEIEDENYDR